MDDAVVSILNNKSAIYANFTFDNATKHYLDWLLPTLDLGIAKILCSLPGLLINVLFVITVFRQDKLWKNLKLLTLLALGDFLIAAFVLAAGLTDVLTNEKHFQLYPYECLYKRPHLILYIWGVHVESMATLFVSMERGIAVWFPYHYLRYDKDKFVNFSIVFCLVFTTCSFATSVIIAVQKGTTTMVYHSLCYPSLMVNVYYSGFLFISIIAMGTLAIIIYVFVFGFELYEKCRQLDRRLSVEVSGSKFAANQRRRQMWLLKISAILAFTAFVCIVIPNAILYIGRNDQSQTSVIAKLRTHIAFFMATNSFFGIALCVVASPELRQSVKATFFCKKYRAESVSMAASVRTRTSRLSSTALNAMKVADEPL